MGRTERILTARLEELAQALERTGIPNAEIAQQLGSASIATENAVALNLISPEAADAIWRAAAARHPRVSRGAPRRSRRDARPADRRSTRRS